MNEEIVKREEQLPAKPSPSVADMLQGVLAGGVTADNAAAVTELTKLWKQTQEWDAEKRFAEAFVALQADMPKVQATTAVPNNDGTIRYRFAPFEDLMAQVGPMLQKHGFTVHFSSRVDDKRITSICTLQHVGGHKRSNEFSARIGSGPPKSTETQADGAAATYVKRFALTECLNIVVAHLDDDARNEGGPITPEQAASLAKRVVAVGSDAKAFLKFAQAETFEEISSVRYASLDEALRRKEKKQ
jgi:hypothetical protein